MAPELLDNEEMEIKRKYEKEVDVWAVGILTYNMLTKGKFPFGIESKDDM